MSAGIQDRVMPRSQLAPSVTKVRCDEPRRRPTSYFRWKGVLDRCVALVLLIPGLPLMGILVLLIRMTSRGPGVYRQIRVGLRGRNYVMYKLRSMRLDAESGTGAVWARQGDSRVTPLGYWLRKLHLDELPQLFNVLKGEMSLIGPRPERPEFVKVLGKEIPGYLDRHEIVPGVTGLAQINLPPDRDLDDVRRKIVLDVEYLQTANLVLDFRIFLCTLLRIIGVRGELAMRWMGLQRTVTLPAAPQTLEETVHGMAGDTTVEFQSPCQCKSHDSQPVTVGGSLAVAQSR